MAFSINFRKGSRKPDESLGVCCIDLRNDRDYRKGHMQELSIFPMNFWIII